MANCQLRILLFFSKVFKLKGNHNTPTYKVYIKNKTKIKTIGWKTASLKGN